MEESRKQQLAEEKSKKYFYAIVGQGVHTKQKYLWEKCGRYKRLEDAEKALIDKNKCNYMNFVHKIIPYYDGQWWTDEEVKKQEYTKTNTLLWKYLESKKLRDEAREYLKENRQQ